MTESSFLDEPFLKIVPQIYENLKLNVEATKLKLKLTALSKLNQTNHASFPLAVMRQPPQWLQIIELSCEGNIAGWLMPSLLI